MNKEPLIKLENVRKTYKLGELELTVLQRINLEIYPGDFISIMGASGSGKSTLMHILGVLDVPTEGKVFWKGRNVSEFSEDELARIRGKEVGFVFQQFNLLVHLTALENVMLPMTFYGVPEEKRRKRAESILRSLDLGERILHKPFELSGGEQQRIAIARSLANDPEIILADEPTGNLDSKTGEMIMNTLVDLYKKENKALLLVTHDFKIASYSEKIINLKDGRIIRQ